jgi:hypothetical protein
MEGVVKGGEEQRDRIGECSVQIEEEGQRWVIWHWRNLVLRKKRPDCRCFPETDAEDLSREMLQNPTAQQIGEL